MKRLNNLRIKFIINIQKIIKYYSEVKLYWTLVKDKKFRAENGLQKILRY